jgi:ABC-2 type transport system ATP-binding protein
MASSNVIRVKGLTKKFGSFVALDDVSFTVKRGEIVGFVGANGAGKTTTISTLLGFIHETKGDVQVLGQIVRPQNAHKTHNDIGYAAGDMELPSRLTGKQYLAFIMHHAEGDHSKRYEELCRRFQPELGKKIKELSRGNKQKIALIGAFVTDPDLIILDEPTSGLDPVMQKVFLDLVLDARIQKKTIFMSSHYLEEVAQVCSRVILMRHGKIIQDIEAEKLLEGSGKQVHIITKYKNTRAPKDAVDVRSKNTKKGMALSFVFKGDMAELQRWLASLKQLEDIEVSEYDLSGAFSSLYEDEEELKK